MTMSRKLVPAVLVAVLLLGAALGMASYTFVYADGASYLTDDPAACANCHVMHDHHAAWLKASHRAVATCNDCHTRPGTVNRYLGKAANGARHSLAFTTGGFAEPLRITPANSRVTEDACRSCHADIAAAMSGPAAHGADAADAADRTSCVRCHRDVGHWVY
jgi:cytochrome c nitrite reductase small subunit